MKYQDAEQAIIGYVISTGDTSVLMGIIGKFENPEYNELSLIASEIAKTSQVDLPAISTEIEKRQSRIPFTTLSEAIIHASASKPDYLVKQIIESSITRQTRKLLAEYQSKVEDIKIIPQLIDDLVKIASGTSEKTEVVHILKEIEQTQGEYLKMHQEGRQTIGYPCGYKFDGMIDGLRPHHIWTLAAYTSAGKTTFAMNIARNILRSGGRVVFFSLEMSRSDILSKIMAIESGIPVGSIYKVAIDNDQYSRYKSTETVVENYKLSIHGEKFVIDDILMAMQQEEAKEHVDLFILDYIQEIESEGDEYSRLTTSMRRLQTTMMRIPSTLLLVSQISNDDNKNAKALFVNGKGTGAIRAASDLFAYASVIGSEEEILDYYKNGNDIPMRIVVNKNRHGKIGAFNVWRRQLTGEITE